MAASFTMPELRDELRLLGHEDLPDDVILSFLSQAQLPTPTSDDLLFSQRSKAASGDFPPPQGVPLHNSSRLVHGRPVPGDRDYGKTKNSRDGNWGGFNSLCFTEDFASEVEEMKKMLRIMEGVKEEIFGSQNSGASSGKMIGLADEHEHYVGKLFSEWRVVGKTLRCKKKENHMVARGWPESSEIVKGKSQVEPELERSDGTAHMGEREEEKLADRCDPHANSSNLSRDGAHEICEHEDVNTQLHGDMNSMNCREEVLNHAEGPATMGEECHEDVTIDKYPSDPGPEDRSFAEGTATDRRLEVVSEEVTMEAELSHGTEGEDYGEKLIYDTLGSPDSSKVGDSIDDNHDLGDTASSTPTSDKARWVSEDSNEHETFASAHRPVPDSANHQFSFPTPLSLPNTRENPPDMPVPLSDPPNGSSSDHHSPFNDRSNMPTVVERQRSNRNIGEDTGRPRARPKVDPKISTSEMSPKGKNSVELSPKGKHYMDSRKNVRLDRGNPPLPPPLDFPDLRLGKSSPPPSARKTRSDKVLRHSVSEKVESARVHPRVKIASDSSDHIEVTGVFLSPTKVAGREAPCAPSEPRHGTCTVCAARRSGESSPWSQKSVPKSPYGASNPNPVATPKGSAKSSTSISGSELTSPRKSTINKGSGIYTPLQLPRETKKTNAGSTVLLKTGRLSTSVDFTDSERSSYRRSVSLRSSSESSRSSGLPGSSNDSKSSHESTLTRSTSNWLEPGSRVMKDKLTPGGPRRGGKVDRVARFAEMQNLWKSDKFLKACGKRKTQSFHRIFALLHESHERFYAAYRERTHVEDVRPSSEPPPFVVPTLLGSSERVKSARPFL